MISLGVIAVVAQFTCGSSVAADRDARNLSESVHARVSAVQRAAKRSVPSGSRLENQFIVVPADEVTAPFDDPADLEGTSLFFRRVDAATFTATRGSLVYDDQVRDLLVSFGRETKAKTLMLSKFYFPFGDQAYDRLTFSSTRGIHFTASPSLPERSPIALEMLTSQAPLISPLYDYILSPASRPNVMYKETSDALTITWRAQNPGVVDYDVQAVLFATGDIRFSYKSVKNVAWGGVVLTTGRPENWLSRGEVIASGTDPAGDVDAVFGSSKGMLDLVGMQVSRIDGSNLLELRLDLSEPIDRQKLNRDASYLFVIGDSLNRIELFIRPDVLHYQIPVAGDLVDSSAVRISGSTIFMYVTEDLLALNARSTKISAYSRAGVPADSIESFLVLGPVRRSAEMDFSAITTIETSQPLVEDFRLPTVNLEGVWQRVKDERGYSDDEIDAVMIYTSFLSDIILKPYGAYALLSNAGADGVSQFSSTSRPRTAMLVNMNHLQAFPDFGTQVLLHEFGHRWLYYFEIEENGVRTRSLNPLSYHPAQYVHTSAAFNVKTAADSSTMGGATFTRLGANMFRTPPAGEWPSGYSWHELYLMGLAAPDEVTSWAYVRDSDPSLGPQYYPPADLTVEGTLVNVDVQQIIAAMGPRQPSYATSQKKFRVLFVVLERPGQPVGALDQQYQVRFEQAFAKATGGRGAVQTSPVVGPRRRAVTGR